LIRGSGSSFVIFSIEKKKKKKEKKTAKREKKYSQKSSVTFLRGNAGDWQI